MTELLREVVSRIERLPPAEQDAIAELMRRELDELESKRRRRAGLAALDRLAELTADLTPVDAVRVARKSREEPERRLGL